VPIVGVNLGQLKLIAIIAYSDTMHTMVITATVLAVFPVIISLLMPDWYLGDKQNAVDDANLAGETTEVSRENSV
jgi:hypothetical protein